MRTTLSGTINEKLKNYGHSLNFHLQQQHTQHNKTNKTKTHSNNIEYHGSDKHVWLGVSWKQMVSVNVQHWEPSTGRLLLLLLKVPLLLLMETNKLSPVPGVEEVAGVHLVHLVHRACPPHSHSLKQKAVGLSSAETLSLSAVSFHLHIDVKGQTWPLPSPTKRVSQDDVGPTFTKGNKNQTPFLLDIIQVY